MSFKKMQSAGPGPQPGRAGLPDPDEFPLFNRDLQEAQDRAGLVRRFDTAPAPVPEQPVHPEFDQINARAERLSRSVFNAEAAFNNPDMLYPDADIDPRAEVPELADHLVSAEQTFYAYLSEHRDVLGGSKQWARQYRYLDAPEPSAEPEWEDLDYHDAPEL